MEEKKQQGRVTRAKSRPNTPTETETEVVSRSESPDIEATIRPRSTEPVLDWAEDVESTEEKEESQQIAGNSGKSIQLQSGLAPRVQFDIISQYSRLTLMKQLRSRAHTFTADSTSLIVLDSEAAQLDHLWGLFNTQHEAFANVCSTEFFSNSYMTEGVYHQALSIHDEAHQIYARIRERLTPVERTASIQDNSNVVSKQTKNLPEIQLPSFSGDYLSWPSFKDLFTSLIIDNSSLQKVEKMHYLKTSVTDSAASIISTMNVSGDAFDQAWAALTTRYENKRLHISTHLDKLLQLKKLPARSGKALQDLLGNISGALNALQALGSPVDQWDQLLVYLITQKLDDSTREAWENKVGPSTEFPTFAQLKMFLDGRARALERLEASAEDKSTTQQRGSKPPARNTHHAFNAQRKDNYSHSNAAYPCDCCQENHYIAMCSKFRDLTPATRKKLVEEHRLCFNCLGHHSSHSVLLATSQALLITPLNTHSVRLLIDPGSELSFITDQQVRLMKLHRYHSKIPISGIGGVKSASTRGVTRITVQSLHSNELVTFNAHILVTLTTTLPSFTTTPENWTHLHGLQLADPEFLTPQPIDIIIGADSYGQIIKPGLRKLNDDSPIAQLTLFGWIVLGRVSSATSHNSGGIYHTTIDHSTQQLHDLLTKFWTQQELIIDKSESFTPEEEECENHFVLTHQRDSSGRYIVRLPFKASTRKLGDSREIAQRCLYRLLKRLAKDSTYNQLYSTFMEEYEQLDHMQPTNQSASNSPSYYLPHHGVLRPTSSTTKLRVVFNGSSSSSTGVSLNDLLHTGPKTQRDLSDILLWVRKHKYLFATDITKMFRQIRVHPEDWKYQRILWRNSAGEVVSYDLTTVTYGTRAAPFLAVRTMDQLVKDEGNRFPLAVEPLTYGRYVDDIYGGSDDIQTLIEIARQVQGLCMAGGFPLAKWQSNHRLLLDDIAENSKNTQTKLIDDSSTTLLGLTWYTYSDQFKFQWKPTDKKSRLTKRIILSEIAQLYDPLGFLAPLIVRAKVLLQELWLLKLNWDDSLPPKTHQQWFQLKLELSQIASLSIPRWLGFNENSTVEIHGFSDSSQLAMAAVIYVRVSTQQQPTRCTFVCSKSRVAPLKKLTIPRLELTAALLLARLTRYVVKTLALTHVPIYLWTDSSVTLTWITSHPSRWKDFVGNRVSQIQELTPNCEWRFISGKENPADCATRGLTQSQLQNHHLWWTGPPWLINSMRHWPAQRHHSDSTVHQEERPGLSLTVASVQPMDQWDLVHRYSSLTRLLRITATCRRAIQGFKKMPQDTVKNPLTPHELYSSKQFWIKSTQAAFFKFEFKALKNSVHLPSSHPFTRLTAFVDTEGIIRVGGRLDNSELSVETKHPAILPRNSHFSGLLIADAHDRTLHGGTQLTLNLLRQSVWIIGGRAPIRSFILRCLRCARLRGIRAQQLMGQLPSTRVTPSRPFTITGVDYAGPLSIKTWKGRGAKIQKGWLCVFICFSTSAIHLEVVSDYSADTFIAAFRRFTGRRGLCHILRSDCGTTFMGAETLLKKLFTQGTQENTQLNNLLVRDQVKWEFIPPAAPHMGGKWEAAVKSVKFHLRRTIGETLLTFEELNTLLIQIESVLNSRPLAPLTDDPDDISALTPGHFLIGHPLNSIVEPSLLDLNSTRLDRWQFIQQRFQCFWKLWSNQYLQQHLSTSKWHHPSNEIKVGSLVLLTDERFPPSKWPLARVTQLHPGKDGLTRIVTLKTATTTLIRPIAKLAILPDIT